VGFKLQSKGSQRNSFDKVRKQTIGGGEVGFSWDRREGFIKLISKKRRGGGEGPVHHRRGGQLWWGRGGGAGGKAGRGEDSSHPRGGLARPCVPSKRWGDLSSRGGGEKVTHKEAING